MVKISKLSCVESSEQISYKHIYNESKKMVLVKKCLQGKNSDPESGHVDMVGEGEGGRLGE